MYVVSIIAALFVCQAAAQGSYDYSVNKQQSTDTKPCPSKGGNGGGDNGNGGGSSGACTDGDFRCPVEQGDGFQKCDHGAWVDIKCGDGTTCNSDLIALNASPCYFPIVGKCPGADGSFKCKDDSNFLKCDHGQWPDQPLQCPAGTKCVEQNDATQNPCVAA